VVGFRATVAVFVLVVSAWDVAVTVIVAGSPAAIVGDVKFPLASIDAPVGLGEIDQVTAVFELPVTVAVNACVADGQPALLGYKLAALGEIELTATGAELLPQAINRPISTSATPSAAPIEYLDHFRPARPTITTPAIGKVNGSHGIRLSARFCILAPDVFGPEVVMVRVTGTVTGPPGVPAAIEAGLNTQTIVGSRPGQLKLTVAAKLLAPPAGVTLNEYPIPGTPASTVAVVTPVLTSAKSGTVTVTVAVDEVPFAFVPT
jgi:hypothetical protein